mgnify:CR=1 FL=1
MGLLDNLFNQQSDPGTTMDGLDANTPQVMPSLPSQEAAAPLPQSPDSQQTALQQMLEQFGPAMGNLAKLTGTPLPQRIADAEKKRALDTYGVKLGEKNPKWRSILRGVVEGMDELGAGYNHTPTAKSKTRQRAIEEYKTEADVLGKEATNVLGRMGQLSQLESKQKIEAAKSKALEAVNRAKAELGGRKLDQKSQEIAIKLQRANSLEAVDAATAEWRQALADNAGKTPDIKNAEQLASDSGFEGLLARIAAAKSGGKTAGDLMAGGGQGRGPSTTIRDTMVVDPATNTMVKQPLSSTTIPTPRGNPDAAAAFMEKMKQLGGQPQAPPPGTPVAPAQPGPQAPSAPPSGDLAGMLSAISGGQPPSAAPAPAPQPAAPLAAGLQGRPKLQVTPQGIAPAPPAPAIEPDAKLPGLTKAPGASEVERGLSGIQRQMAARMTPEAGKKYNQLKDSAAQTLAMVDSVKNAALTFTGDHPSSDLARYSGLKGGLTNLIDKISDNKTTSTQVASKQINEAGNAYRHAITGAGASMREINFLLKNFPEDPGSWGIEGHHTMLQKALVLHFASQKHFWDYSHAIGKPESYQNMFNEGAITGRIDSILNDYRQYEKQMQATPSNKRAALKEKFESQLNEKMNAKKFFDEQWLASTGQPTPSSEAASKQAPIVIRYKR